MIMRLLSSFMALIMSLLAFAPAPEKKCEPKFNGTFIQSWMCSWWDDDRWQEEISVMEEAGIDYLVVQSTATFSGGEWLCYYESQTPALKDAFCGADVIEGALRNCASSDIRVFIGLADYENWWTFGGLTREYYDDCALMAEMEKEIYNKYYNRYADTFYGWYFTPEISNSPMHKLSIAGIAGGLNKVLDTATELDSSLPMLISPFFSEYDAVPSVLATLPMWQLFMQTVNFRDGDIFCPQDAVGAGWVREKDLEKTWQMYSAAVESCKKDIHLWANCENMTAAIVEKGLFTPPVTLEKENMTSTLDRFVRQMNTVSRYAENIITFSFNHYYSPYNGNRTYFDTYLDYLENDYTLENEAPTVPGEPKAENDVLTWEESTDNIGIAYYIVYEDGNALLRVEATEEAKCEITKGHTYKIIALDGAGNKSGFSKEVGY